MSLDRAIDVLATRESILVFTGAGISTESGIPDFRGPDGVWTKVDPEDFTIQRYVASVDVRRRSWAMRAESGVLEASPNDGHRAIVDLWGGGRMIGCVTQNIDGLHADAGLPLEALVEVHGNARSSRCIDCGQTVPTTQVLERVEAGDDDPRCSSCHGILKADVVFFGEAMPEREMTRAMAMASAADAVISVGSTLSVYPAAYVPLSVTDAGLPLVIVNQGPTDLDRLAEVRIDAPAGEAMRALADALA